MTIANQLSARHFQIDGRPGTADHERHRDLHRFCRGGGTRQLQIHHQFCTIGGFTTMHATNGHGQIVRSQILIREEIQSHAIAIAKLLPHGFPASAARVPV